MKGINNLRLKILSVFLAFLIWLTVVNLSNPEVEGKREVPLEIENEQVLTDAGRTYEISGKNTVTVYFDVRTRDEYKIRSSDFRAYVDLAELYDVTGSVQVKVEVLNNKELISVAEAKPGVVRVLTEDLQTKIFDLTVETSGKAADGYAVNGISLTPSSITVQGPVSKVGLISYAGIEIDLAEATEDVSGTTQPVFYDANGNALVISDRIEVNTAEVQYLVGVNKVKELPLDFEVTGTVAPGYRYTGVECATRTISVTGLKSNLASLTKVTVPASELNINGATADKLVTVDIRNFLPEGVELAGSVSPEIQILLKVEKLVSMEVGISSRDIELVNAAEEYNYRFLPARINVTVQGLEEDLAVLDGADLNAYVDLSGLTAGPHEGSLQFAESDVFTILSVEPFQIDVVNRVGMVSDAPGATESTAQEPAETEGDTGPETSADQTAGSGTVVEPEGSLAG